MVIKRERDKCRRIYKVLEFAPLRWPACSTLGIRFGYKRRFWNLWAGAVSPPSKVLPKALIAAVAIDRTDKPRAYTTEVASRQTDRQLLDRFPT
jgi:hypothetical protein